MIVCTHPRDGYELTVDSTMPPTAIAVTAGSTPFRFVPGSGGSGASRPPPSSVPPGAGEAAGEVSRDAAPGQAMKDIRDIPG
ncbi:hypothetical protein [Streptodolium elevatio]